MTGVPESIVNTSGAANTAIDVTYDVSMLNPDTPIILQISGTAQPTTGALVQLNDADTGFEFTLGQGVNVQMPITFNALVAALIHRNPGGPNDNIAICGMISPNQLQPTQTVLKRLRIRIGALGVGVSAAWVLFGERV